VLQVVLPVADIAAAVARGVLAVPVGLVVLPEALVDVAIRVVIPAFPVRHVVGPFTLVAVAVLEDFLTLALPLAVLIDVAGVDGCAVLRQSLLLDKR
jgi:hypothetical protein